ncbi:MAG: phosphoribosylglycinamide formyltransferase [Clostridiaceae bacterium]|nr:phosphoribosylglycinamide formyltransferase [Clostridiaceae bacterium]
MLMKKNIAVLVSGGGSNLQSLIDSQKNTYFQGEIKLVISNNKNAYGLERAKQNQIPAFYINKQEYPQNEDYDQQILKLLKEYQIDLIVLAGYLKYVTPILIDAYKNKIMNIHPALLPAFGGKNFYGMKVHQALYERGAKISGATVHFVDAGQDTGPIIVQESIPLDQNWQPEDIQKAVLKVEHKILPLAVKYFCENRLTVEKTRVYIKDKSE